MKTKIEAIMSFVLLSMVPTTFFFFSAAAEAFEPWKSGQSQFLFGSGEAGPLDASHQSITEDAIKQFANENPTLFGSRKPTKAAIETIVLANATVDHPTKGEASVKQAHFDSETFFDGQARLRDKLRDIKDRLNVGNIRGAREALGQAFHTIQDFYSHSNWVEGHQGHEEVYPWLGRLGTNGYVSLPVAPKDTATCTDCSLSDHCLPRRGLHQVPCNNNLVPTYLWTSGYFRVVSDTKPLGKCSHGGCLDATSASSPIGGINKDTSNSYHGSFHATAAALALEASKLFLTNLQTDAGITREQVVTLLCGPTLAISIDTTGSMDDIIEAVKNEAIAIVNRRLHTDEEPGEYVLAPFNDPDVPNPIVTSDPNVFKSAISSLSASGGGDCPELAQTGAFKAISASSSSGNLFLFTDADAKDASRATEVRDLGANKKIRAFFQTFPSTGVCRASGSADSSAPVAVTKSGRSTSSGKNITASPMVDSSYQEVAEGTGGQVFSLDRSEAGQITTLLDDVSRSNAVNLLSIQDTLVGPDPYGYYVFIDNTLSAVTFSVSGDVSATLIRPDGHVVQEGDPGVTITSLSGAHLFSITNPQAGEWELSLSGSGAFSITVTGQGTLDIKSFDFVQDLSAQAHEPGLFPIDGFPVALQTNIVSAELTGGFSSAQFQFRSPNGVLLQVLDLQRGTGTANTVFVGSVIPPAAPFLVYVRGSTAAGARFQRILPGTITPQSVTIEAPPPANLVSGGLTTYTFRVHNLGPIEGFNFTAIDDKGFLAGVWPTSFYLSYNETQEVTVTLRPPPDAVVGTSDTLTVNVASNLINSRNFAVVVSNVTLPPPPIAHPARYIASNGFTANWSSVSGATGYRLDVSTSSSFSTYVSGYHGLSVGNATSRSVTGLNPSTTYYYRVRAHNAAGTSGNSNIIHVTTLSPTGPPVAITNPASYIASFSARLNGSVDPHGFTTSVYFQYGTTTGYGLTTAIQSKTGNTYQSVVATIGALTASTTYHFRIVATNSNGTRYGSDRTFTTLSPTGLPVAITNPATNGASSSATLNGSVDPHGLTTTVHFQYGTTTSYGHNTANQSKTGNAYQNVAANISGLSAHTTYHFRLVATNSAGTRYGSDRTFTTTP